MTRPMTESLMLRYLLGDLPEGEREQVEATYFDDDDVFQSLCAREEELFRDYVRGELPAVHRELFVARLASHPDVQERLQVTKVLLEQLEKEAARAREQKELQPRETGRSGWYMSLLAAAATFLLLASGWLLMQNRQLQTQASEERAIRERLASELESLAARVDRRAPPVSFLLTPGLTRAESARQTSLRLPTGAEEVRLQLESLHGGDGNRESTCRVVLTTVAGDQVWSADGLPYESGDSGARVDLSLPVAVLTPDDYILYLLVPGPPGEWEELAAYSFRTTRD